MSWPKRHLGHGIGLRTSHFPHVLEHGTGGVDWLEVISENFFEPGGRPWAVLNKAREQVPVVLHGVSLGIGNSDPLDGNYLAALVELIRRVEPAWVSDHLCWGGYGGHYAHDLLPLPYSEEALEHVVTRVERVQERLGRQILLENVSSYVAFCSSSLREWEFLAEVARRAGSGILLDVNNVVVSAHNHGFSAETYVDASPSESIGQIHLAGHTDAGNYLFDSHVGPVPLAAWALYERVIARTGPVPTLVEWDEAVPAAMRSDCARLHALIGEGHFHNLVTDYLLVHPSRHPSLRHLPRHLAGFLRGHPVSERWPAASELAALEWARAGAFDAADTPVLTREQLVAVAPERWDAMRLSFVASLQLLDVEYAVHDLWRQLESGLAAAPPERAPVTLLVWRRALVVYHRPIPAEEASALRTALGGAPFGAVCVRVAEVVGEAQAAPAAAALVARWVSDGLLSAVTLVATGGDGNPSHAR